MTVFVTIASRSSRLALALSLGIALGLGGTTPLHGQEHTALAIEAAAARHMLARPHGFSLRDVTIDPALSDSISAPGAPGPNRRDSARTSTLTRVLGARVQGGVRSGTVHLTLSDPVVRADTANVTATMAWPAAGGRPSGYETIALLLVRERGTWRVVRTRQLGIS